MNSTSILHYLQRGIDACPALLLLKDPQDLPQRIIGTHFRQQNPETSLKLFRGALEDWLQHNRKSSVLSTLQVRFSVELDRYFQDLSKVHTTEQYSTNKVHMFVVVIFNEYLSKGNNMLLSWSISVTCHPLSSSTVP